MNDTTGDYEVQFAGFDQLMPFRVREILLVASPYDSFIFAEDDRLTEAIFSEYLDMNLRYAPRITRVDNGEEALKLLESRSFDLLITMMRVGTLPIGTFAKGAKNAAADLPLVLLAHNPMNIARLEEEDRACFERVFLWSGDIRILLAIIKLVEDIRNAAHDVKSAEVQTLILVENSVRFYSYYLPLIYTEIMAQTQQLLSESMNLTQRLIRQRARPKILLATNYEDAWELYGRYRDNLLCLITDNNFPRGGELVRDAGLELIRHVKDAAPDTPVLLQSSDTSSAEKAEKLRASFLAKSSQDLRGGIQSFLKENCGFGDFLFRCPDGNTYARASDLPSLLRGIQQAPGVSITYHADNNHFSKWLRARTEFELAHIIQPKKTRDFESVEQLRGFLVEAFEAFLRRAQIGQIFDFSMNRFNADSPFVRIGTGSFGGKGRGLAFLNFFLGRNEFSRRWPGIRIRVPNTTVIATDIFDDFMDRNDLHAFVRGDPEDREVCERFLNADLSPELMSRLKFLISQVDYPLAVRSSSLMEDSQLMPLAGVYETYMLPNKHSDSSVRLGQLSQAIRLVYASTFYREARTHLRAGPHKQDQEKMAVVIQRLAGSERGGRFYPDVSGVAQSYNYYAVGDMSPKDGLAFAALGLGKTVADGRLSLRFSPAHPRNILQFANTKEMLANSQRKFIALDLSISDAAPSCDSAKNLLQLDLAEAEKDGALAPLASTYSHENDRVYEGIYRKGVRLVTFSEILNGDRFPLASILRELLAFGEKAVGCPVELEYAVDLAHNEFDILQIRPMMSFSLSREVRIDEADWARSICGGGRTLGHGQHTDILDILYVKPDAFSPVNTSRIAREIGVYNARLRDEGRSYVLIGPGRWGSADHSLGIPVVWSEISEAKLIVETTLPGFVIEPSFGSHFLHNVISLGIGYFSIRPERNEGKIDWAWLNAQTAVYETGLLRHVRLPSPLDVRIDGRHGQGAVLKPLG